VRTPESVEQLQELVTASPRIRALGERHSFNELADSAGILVSLVDRGSGSGSGSGSESESRLDTERMTVSVSAGTRYGVLASWLNARGFALQNCTEGYLEGMAAAALSVHDDWVCTMTECAR